jgi:ferrous iron transport protein B
MKRIALVGMPNTGKSALFNRLTGGHVRVGNWPGVTVDLYSAKVFLGGEMVEIVDLPGIYDLSGFAEDEQVTRHFLENHPVDLVLVVINAAQIDRQIRLAIEVQNTTIPMAVALNMADEAKRYGIEVDVTRLQEKLRAPCVLLSAKFGNGVDDLKSMLQHALRACRPPSLQSLQQHFINEDAIDKEAKEILKASVRLPQVLPRSLTQKIDALTLHPIWGLPLFFLILLLLFQATYGLGTPLQDGLGFLFDHFRAFALVPLANILPAMVYGFLVEGVYDGIATVLSFVPIIVLFFVLMGFVEESGYLGRAAFLMDAFMARLGLDGRAFVMLLMGFGCNVPALMGTRVMRSRTSRLLTMLMIPFSLCSARLQVFVFIIGAVFTPRQAPFVLLSLYLASFAAAFLTAFLFKRRLSSSEPFAMELPPYRLPTTGQVLIRAWLEIRYFLKRASTFIVIGVVFVWLLTHLPPSASPGSEATWAGMIGNALAPVMKPIGIDPLLTIALIFGFVAKEILIGALAIIYGREGDGLAQLLAMHMDWVKAYSFMLFTLLYTPCLSTIATLRSESKSLGFTFFALFWALGIAWIVSFVFYQSARWLGL